MSKAHDAVRRTLWVEWSLMLPRSQCAAAWRWLSGPEALVTLGAQGDRRASPKPPEVSIEFYESVSWSESLAQHWIALALRYAKVGNFKQAMRVCGYTFERPPKFDALEASFFEHGNKIGELFEDEVIWQLPTYERVKASSVSKTVLGRARAARENGCSCSYCKTLGIGAADARSVARRRKRFARQAKREA